MATPQKLKVGRAPGNDIIVDHPTVSRLHVELVRNADGSVDIFDKGSAVGTFVLHDGAWVQFEHATVGADETVRLGDFETTPTLLLAGYKDPFDAITQRGDKSPHTQRPSRPTKSGDPAGAPAPRPVPGAKPDAAPPPEEATRRSDPKPAAETPAPKSETRPSRPEPGTEAPVPETETRRSRPEPAQRPEPETRIPEAAPPSTPQAPPATVAPAGPTGGTATKPASAATQAPSQAGAKSMLVAYLLWFFLGVFGAHRFYLGSMIPAIIMLVLALVSGGVTAWNPFVGVVPLVLLVLWWLVDGFLTHDMVKKLNTGGGAAAPPPQSTP